MIRISLVAATIVALCTCLPLFAQEPEPAPSLGTRVDAVFSGWNSTNSPGCAISVVKDGTIVYAQGYGMANLDHDVPIRTDTVFHVASVSKEFAAAAIALLSLEGKLSLDDPIQKHLPWVADFGHEITIRNLVHHNSGLRDQWSLLGMSGWRYSKDQITNDDVIYLIERQRDLNFVPGERYLYSNTGYTLMGLIVKKVSGQSLREFTTKRIFEPLGMMRTHFRDDFSEIVKDQAFGYRWDDDTKAFHTSVTNFDTVGATSLLTTVEDMARWDRNFIDPVVGGQVLLDLMHQRGILNDGEPQNYAFGLVHGTYRGLSTVGHGGADAGYRSHFVRFPDQGYSFVTLCNLAQTNPGRLARDVADIYIEQHLEPVTEEAAAEMTPVALTDEAIARIEGTYFSEEMALVLRVRRDEEGLRLNFGGRPAEMIHTGDGRFAIPEMDRMMRFEPATDAVQRVRFWIVGEDDDADSAMKLAPSEMGEGALEEFVGNYSSPELPVTYHIDLQEEQLTIHWLKRAPRPLTLISADWLAGDDVGSLRFRRDASGRIAGFTLDSGRVRNFRFERAK